LEDEGDNEGGSRVVSNPNAEQAPTTCTTPSECRRQMRAETDRVWGHRQSQVGPQTERGEYGP
jgi:hypothetical protein